MPNVARLYSELGDVYARAAEGRRQFWGQAIAGITGIPSQIIAAKQAQQKEQRKAAYDDAHLALERANFALKAGEIRKADEEYALSKQLNEYQGQVLQAAQGEEPGSFDVQKARQAALSLTNVNPAVAPKVMAWVEEQNKHYNPAPVFHPPGSKGVNPNTGQRVPGAEIPEEIKYGNPEPRMVGGKRTLVRTATQGENTWSVDLGGNKLTGVNIEPDAPPVASQTHTMRLAGVGDVPVDYVPNKEGTGGTWRYQGKDVTGQVRAIPPASIQVQNMITADAKNAAPVDANRPDPATANIPDPKTGMTPNAMFQGAVTFALEGKPPSVGMGNNPRAAAIRAGVANKAGALAAASGVDLPQLQAEYKANALALNKLLPQAKATASAANAATDNLDLALQQSDKVSRTGSALVNRYVQWAQGSLTPAAGLTKFETYVYTAAREYAKVTSGGALSAQGLTDSAAKEATKLLNTAQSPDAFAAAVGAMKDDMANVITNQGKTLAGISSTIGNFFSVTNGGRPVDASAPPKVESGALKEGTLGTVQGVPAVWKTVNGKAGWYAR